jgi:cytochrome c-type biogenesis protein CcmH
MKRALAIWFLGIALVALATSDARADTRPGAAALEARLYAPCCYGGTLDTHDSDLARDLRREIEGRLAGGEESASIQADFVSRYGERVVAARSDTPIRAMGLWMVGLTLAAAVGLGFALRRWTRKPEYGAPLLAAAGVPDAFDERLDAELADLDGH